MNSCYWKYSSIICRNYCREDEDAVTFLHVISRWFFIRVTFMCRAYAFWWVCKWARKSCNSWLEYHNSWWLIVILLVVRISRTRSLSKDTCLCSCMLSVSLLLLLLLLLVLLSVIMIDSFDWFCLLVLLFYLFGLFVILLNLCEQQHRGTIKGSRFRRSSCYILTRWRALSVCAFLK